MALKEKLLAQLRSQREKVAVVAAEAPDPINTPLPVISDAEKAISGTPKSPATDISGDIPVSERRTAPGIPSLTPARADPPAVEQGRSGLQVDLTNVPVRLIRDRDGLKFGRLAIVAPAPYKPARDSEGRLLPGHTANPLGKPPSLARYVYEVTGGGQEMIDHAVQVMRGSAPIHWQNDEGMLCERMAPASIKDQADARVFLQTTMQPELDKVAAATEGARKLDFSRLTYDEVAEFRRLLTLAQGELPPPSGLMSRPRAEVESDAELVPSPTVPPPSGTKH
jgi:hypothetical protein